MVLVRPDDEDQRRKDAIEQVKGMLRKVDKDISIEVVNLDPSDFEGATRRLVGLLGAGDELVVSLAGGDRALFLALAVAVMSAPVDISTTMVRSDITRDFQETRLRDVSPPQHIKEGRDDIQKITEATTLENHEVNYCFTKLEELGLIEVEKPDGMVESVVGGQKRVFEAPKQAELTETGLQYLESTERRGQNDYEKLSHRGLVEKVHEIENQVEELKGKLRIFRKQVMDQIQ